MSAQFWVGTTVFEYIICRSSDAKGDSKLMQHTSYLLLESRFAREGSIHIQMCFKSTTIITGLPAGPPLSLFLASSKSFGA